MAVQIPSLFRMFLQDEQIGTRYLFAGNLVKQPYFVDQDINYRIVGDLTNTNIVMNNTFWLGVYPGLTTEMLSHVIKCLTDFLSDYE
ncbi:MAG: DegT/DnrJ/EryC1/StrS family aminotransferase [Nitrospirae bacterium]|nr:DegT/DnrJ/EryC1/StrS family aminotransferase [Nitrospirota bacterium]